MRLVEEAGPVDVLVANAGNPGSGRLESFAVEEIDRALDVNLRAPIILARLMCEGMAERGGGHIVFVSSLSGKAATPRTSVYAATKFGLRGFAMALREDLRAARRRRVDRVPGLHPRRRHVPRRRHQAAGLRGHQDAGGRRRRGGVGDRARPGGGRRRADRACGSARRSPMLAPELSANVQRRLGADEIASRMETGQRDKR